MVRRAGKDARASARRREIRRGVAEGADAGGETISNLTRFFGLWVFYDANGGQS